MLLHTFFLIYTSPTGFLMRFWAPMLAAGVPQLTLSHHMRPTLIFLLRGRPIGRNTNPPVANALFMLVNVILEATPPPRLRLYRCSILDYGILLKGLNLLLLFFHLLRLQRGFDGFGQPYRVLGGFF